VFRGTGQREKNMDLILGPAARHHDPQASCPFPG
jgi:hypothetical protein